MGHRSPLTTTVTALGAAAALALGGAGRADAQGATGGTGVEHGHGTHAGTDAPLLPATAAERAALDRQVTAIRRATERYRDVRAARADGYVPFGREAPLMGEHWYRKGVKEPPEGTPLDLEHPGTLQYAVVGGDRVLVGVAFGTRLRRDDPLPAGFAGEADHWHQHDLVKAVRAGTEDRPVLRWIAGRWLDGARRARDGRPMLTMVHAWVWLDNPDGVFAMHHRVIPYLKAGLPASFATAAGEKAARGLDLAGEGGCARALDGELWMAHASPRQTRHLRAACDRVARDLRALLARTPAPATLNAAAAAAWESLAAARRASYTPRQQERIGSVTEAMM